MSSGSFTACMYIPIFWSILASCIFIPYTLCGLAVLLHWRSSFACSALFGCCRSCGHPGHHWNSLSGNFPAKPCLFRGVPMCTCHLIEQLVNLRLLILAISLSAYVYLYLSTLHWTRQLNSSLRGLGPIPLLFEINVLSNNLCRHLV